ncbi:hypothetical protein [Streptomyces sp. NPDC058678]|uniref:hypothetical protein n=1 Tax=Streptomyces sp. NPDC058678 TaxID=3346595 RepID=UPI00364D7A90
MSHQDPMPNSGREPGPEPGRALTIPLRYWPGTGFALSGAISAGITWQYIPQDATWPLSVIGMVAMICDAAIIISRSRARPRG